MKFHEFFLTLSSGQRASFGASSNVHHPGEHEHRDPSCAESDRQVRRASASATGDTREGEEREERREAQKTLIYDARKSLKICFQSILFPYFIAHVKHIIQLFILPRHTHRLDIFK